LNPIKKEAGKIENKIEENCGTHIIIIIIIMCNVSTREFSLILFWLRFALEK
jgi:hypothetical protein